MSVWPSWQVLQLRTVKSRVWLSGNIIFRLRLHQHIHTRIQNVHMNARKARLKRRRGSDCAGSPTLRQEPLPFSLFAAIRRGIPFVGGPPKRGQFSAILAGFSLLLSAMTFWLRKGRGGFDFKLMVSILDILVYSYNHFPGLFVVFFFWVWIHIQVQPERSHVEVQ